MMVLVDSARTAVSDRITHEIDQERRRVKKLRNEFTNIPSVFRRGRNPCSGYTRKESICQIKIASLESQEDFGEW
jgi:hypothetical protein